MKIDVLCGLRIGTIVLEDGEEEEEVEMVMEEVREVEELSAVSVPPINVIVSAFVQ